QILAYETDLLEYGDIFDGSAEIARKVDALKREAREELDRIEQMGGAVKAVESGYMKQQLVESNTARLEAVERGEQVVVGVNIMPASIQCAKAGVTTGEWGWTLREAFGEYRAPTGVGRAMRNDVTGL